MQKSWFIDRVPSLFFDMYIVYCIGSGQPKYNGVFGYRTATYYQN